MMSSSALLALALTAALIVVRSTAEPHAGAALRGLAMMSGMTSEDPVIDFAGSSHVAFTKWQANENGVWQHLHFKTRPGWQKNTRCAGNSSMSCEECAGQSDCWSNADGFRQVRLASGARSSFPRYLSTIHVRCDSPSVRVSYEIGNLQSGQLRILWDGVDVSQQGNIQSTGLESPMVEQIGSGSLDISADHAGAHTLELEFTPFTDDSSVQLSKFEVSMPKTFADCEDYKACLDPISTSNEFRNNNWQQLGCLQDAHPFSEDCARWRGCLTAEDQSQLRTLLRAAGVGGYDLNASDATNESDVYFVPSGPSEDGAGVHCINPLVQDAESWSCDCFEDMHSSCAAVAASPYGAAIYTEELCIRAKFCEHPRVCSAWKELACDEPEIQDMQKAVELVETSAQHRALFARSGGRVGNSGAGEGEALDRALGDKGCA